MTTYLNWGTMAESALRAVALAGLVSVGVMIAAPVAAPAGAQPDSDTGSQSDDSGDAGDAATTGGADDESDGEIAVRSGAGDETPESEKDDDLTEILDGPDDSASKRRDSGFGILPPPRNTPRTFDYSHSLRIPLPRLPAPGEIPQGSWPTVSSFYTTVEIPVPTLQEFLQALTANPTPAPPGPSIRTQEEEPVVDAATGAATSGGGGGAMMSEAPVIRAPLVVAVPRIATVGGQGSRPVESVAAPAPGVTQPGTAGARTPVIRGSLPPSPQASPQSVSTPLAAPSARLGYPRSLTSPTLAELTAVALPGVAGLVLLTFGGTVIGYRQANSTRFVRTAGAERFLP